MRVDGVGIFCVNYCWNGEHPLCVATGKCDVDRGCTCCEWHVASLFLCLVVFSVITSHQSPISCPLVFPLSSRTIYIQLSSISSQLYNVSLCGSYGLSIYTNGWNIPLVPMSSSFFSSSNFYLLRIIINNAITNLQIPVHYYILYSYNAFIFSISTCKLVSYKRRLARL